MFQKIKNMYHLFQAIIANVWYGFPSRGLTVIGVTGTDGKTTTTSLIYHMIQENGKKVAMISSVGAYIGGKQYDIGFHVTTPSPFGVQKYIKKAVEEGCEYVVLETTSHALDQFRVWGVTYAIGVLTNITREHLDYHKNYSDYLSAKKKLLHMADKVVVNKDDGSYEHITADLVGKEVLTYSLSDVSADITLKKFPFKTHLLGDFNKQNCLAAIGACLFSGVSSARATQAIHTFTPPKGRQEVVYDKEFQVIIDFAHTPNAFRRFLPEVKKITKGRLIHVFGSAGLRDHTKRPDMGRASSESSDIIILTAEDPRTESLEKINAAIVSGIPEEFIRSTPDWAKNQKKKQVIIVNDRKKAITLAIFLAKKGDTVVVTGKAHETSMNYGHGEEAWDEFKAAEEAVEKRRKKT